jgi:hypothetical protein
MSFLDFDVWVLLWIKLISIYVWYSRDDEDGMYRLFKDMHQTNLDDIERQKLEEQQENY